MENKTKTEIQNTPNLKIFNSRTFVILGNCQNWEFQARNLHPEYKKILNKMKLTIYFLD